MKNSKRIRLLLSTIIMVLTVLMGGSAVYAATSGDSGNKLDQPYNIRTSYENGAIKVRWDAVPTADGYWVYVHQNYDKNKVTKKRVEVTNITISNVKIENNYTISLCACAGSGDETIFSEWTQFNVTSQQLKDTVKRAEEAKMEAEKPAKLDTPKVDWYFDGANVVMTWNEVPGATAYRVGLYQGVKGDDGSWSYNGDDPIQVFNIEETSMNLGAFNGTEEYVLGVKAISKESSSDEYAFVGLINDYYSMSIEDSVALNYDQLLMFLNAHGYGYDISQTKKGFTEVSVTIDNKNVPKGKLKRIGKSFKTIISNKLANADTWGIAGDIAGGAIENKYNGESWGDSVKASTTDTIKDRGGKAVGGALFEAYMESTTDPNMHLFYYFDPANPNKAAINMSKVFLTMYDSDFVGEFYKDKNLIDIGSGDYMYYTESGRPQ